MFVPIGNLEPSRNRPCFWNVKGSKEVTVRACVIIPDSDPSHQMLPGFENLLFAHSSWFTYTATMRIYKHWDFHIAEPHTATGKLSFSSYPGRREEFSSTVKIASPIPMKALNALSQVSSCPWMTSISWEAVS